MANVYANMLVQYYNEGKGNSNPMNKTIGTKEILSLFVKKNIKWND